VKIWFCALIVLICWGIGPTGVTYSIPPAPKEPAITHLIAWTTHPVLGVVFLYTVDGIDLQCGHALFYKDMYPECQGLVGKTDHCMPVSVEENYIVLITYEPIPWVYGVSSESSMCLLGWGDFMPVTEKTYERR